MIDETSRYAPKNLWIACAMNNRSFTFTWILKLFSSTENINEFEYKLISMVFLAALILPDTGVFYLYHGGLRYSPK